MDVLVDQELARVTCVKERIDLALHNPVGKALDVPVYMLLGGKYRDRVRVASEIGFDTPENMADNARDVLDDGISVIKLKGSNEPDVDIERIRAVRNAVGDDVPLRIDPNAAWDTMTTVRVMGAVEDCHLQYVEQPIPTGDFKGLAHVRRTIEPSVNDGRRRLDQGRRRETVRVRGSGPPQPQNREDLWITPGQEDSGGGGRCRDMPCVAGTELEPGIAAFAKVHFAASMRSHPLASEFTELTQLDGSIFAEPLQVIDGCLDVPEGPGFGVKIDEDRLAEYAIEV